MTKFLISFPSEAMVLTEEEFPIVVADSHAVIEEANAPNIGPTGQGSAAGKGPSVGGA